MRIPRSKNSVLQGVIQENKRYSLENTKKELVGIQENRRSEIVVKDS